MKPTRREVLALEDEWNGNFGRFLKQLLTEYAEGAKEDGSKLIPTSKYEMIEREQIFGKARAFTELLEIIPQKIKELNLQTQDQSDE